MNNHISYGFESAPDKKKLLSTLTLSQAVIMPVTVSDLIEEFINRSGYSEQCIAEGVTII